MAKTLKIAAAHNRLYALRERAFPQNQNTIYLYQYGRWEELSPPWEVGNPVDIACAMTGVEEGVVDCVLYVLTEDDTLWMQDNYGRWTAL